MAAITGAAGLPSTLAAIRRGGAIALANKEALVCAGEVMLRAVREAGATLLPVDSEHNAIFQALAEGNRGAVEKIVLTASGGPFRNATADEMARATPERRCGTRSGRWAPRSASIPPRMMNKGLELIEAARLFGLEEDADRRAGPPAIRRPRHGPLPGRQRAGPARRARHAHPDRPRACLAGPAWQRRSPRLDLAALGRLEFCEPDPVRFPALRLARDALRAGGGAPTILIRSQRGRGRAPS